MRSSRRNRSNCGNISRRNSVDQAKAARAKAAVKAAKSKSPKLAYKNRKLKAAFDLETPKSLLVNIRLKSVINLDTYNLLSSDQKESIFCLLPSCDQQRDQNGAPFVHAEALNNEFFAKACVEWCERLGEGEFLKDRQQGDATWKVRQFGALNGVKSQLFDGFLLGSSNSRNRFRVNSNFREPIEQFPDDMMKLTNSRRHARKNKLLKIVTDETGSVISETSSDSSFSLPNERLVARSHRHSIDNGAFPADSLTYQDMASTVDCGLACPALIDHNYCMQVPFSRPVVSNDSSWCKNSRTNNQHCSRTACMQPGETCGNQPRGFPIRRRGRVPRLLGDYVVDGSGIISTTIASDQAGASKFDDIDCRYCRDLRNNNVSVKLTSSKTNSRCAVRPNGVYSDQKTISNGVVASPQLQDSPVVSLAKVLETFTACDSSDCRCVPPNKEPENILDATEHELTGQNSGLLTSLKKSNKCLVSDEKTNDTSVVFPSASPKSLRSEPPCKDSDHSSTSVPVPATTGQCTFTTPENSDLEKPLTVADSFSVPSNHKKVYMKCIAIQKIQQDSFLKTSFHELAGAEPKEFSSLQYTSNLPENITKEVQSYVCSGATSPRAGLYSFSAESNKRDVVNFSTPDLKFHEKLQGSCTGSKLSKTRGVELGKSMPDQLNYGCTFGNDDYRTELELVEPLDCIWEAMFHHGNDDHPA